MKVEHIIWEDPPHEGVVYGILKLTYGFHGDDHVGNIIVEGSYCLSNREARVANKAFLTDSCYVHLVAVGRIS